MPIVDTQFAQRAAIKALLEGIIPTIGAIQDYERTGLVSYRYPNDADSSPVQGFSITNADSSGKNVERISPLDSGTVLIVRMWTIRGYWQIDDANASELTFRDILGKILYTLTPERSLTGTAIVAGYPRLVTFRGAMMLARPFHYAEIELETRDAQPVTPQ